MRNLKHGNIRGVIVILLLVFIFAACHSGGGRQADVASSLEQQCYQLSYQGQFDKSDSLARLLHRYAVDNDDNNALMQSLYFLGVYNYHPQEAEHRRKNLEECQRLLDDYPNDSIQLRVHNALAIYEAFQLQF